MFLVLQENDIPIIFTDAEKLRECWKITYSKVENPPELIIPWKFDLVRIGNCTIQRVHINQSHL